MYECGNCNAIYNDTEAVQNIFRCRACGNNLSEEKEVVNKNFKSKPKKQVNGSHYEQAIEPIEYIEANELGFHEANVIKYVSRHSKKNGKEDIEKAIWYLNRIIETKY